MKNETLEERLTERVRQFLVSDYGEHEHWTETAADLIRKARDGWTASEHWSQYQSVVFTLEDMMADKLKERTNAGEYSLIGEVTGLAMAFVNYLKLAHAYTDSGWESIQYGDDPHWMFADIEQCIGPWNYQEWKDWATLEDWKSAAAELDEMMTAEEMDQLERDMGRA